MNGANCKRASQKEGAEDKADKEAEEEVAEDFDGLSIKRRTIEMLVERFCSCSSNAFGSSF
jgi:hypothetical protein